MFQLSKPKKQLFSLRIRKVKVPLNKKFSLGPFNHQIRHQSFKNVFYDPKAANCQTPTRASIWKRFFAINPSRNPVLYPLQEIAASVDNTQGGPVNPPFCFIYPDLSPKRNRSFSVQYSSKISEIVGRQFLKQFQAFSSFYAVVFSKIISLYSMSMSVILYPRPTSSRKNLHNFLLGGPRIKPSYERSFFTSISIMVRHVPIVRYYILRVNQFIAQS